MSGDLQNDFTKFGEEKFVFEIVDTLEPNADLAHNYSGDLKVFLEMWMEKLQPYSEIGYNKRK